MVLSQWAKVRLEFAQKYLAVLQKRFPVLQQYSIKVTNTRGVLGLCNLKHHHILLHSSLLDLGTHEQVRQVLLHEAAHALDGNRCVRGGAHGIRWKYYCKILGIPASVGYRFCLWSSLGPTGRACDYRKLLLRFNNARMPMRTFFKIGSA